MITFTRSGYTTLRAARERPLAAVLSITPELPVARRLALVWGVHSSHAPHGVSRVAEMVDSGCALARDEGFAKSGDIVVIAAGMPFGSARTTNLLHIVQV